MSAAIPPHNPDAENACIAAIMCDSRCAEVAFSVLEKSDFYQAKNQAIFHVASDLFSKNGDVDEIVLCEELQSRGLLTSAGGREYIGKLIVGRFDISSIEEHCKVVREKSEERAIFNLNAELADRIARHERPDTLLEMMNDRLDKIASRRLNILGEPEDMHDLAAAVAKDAMNEKPRDHWGLCCGIAGGAIDDLVGGFSRGHYRIIAARTSMGKSTFCNALARGIGECNPDEGEPLIVSTEMAPSGLARASLATTSGVHMKLLQQRKLNAYERESVQKVIESRQLAGVKVIYLAAPTVNQIKVIAKRHKRKYGLPMLIVDLAGKCRGQGNSDYERLSAISRGLHDLKSELDTCVIACVQVSRGVHLNEDQRPCDKDLKGTGSWEEDADQLIFLHRPSYYDRGRDDRTEIILQKDRDNGNVGSTFISFDRKTGAYIKALSEPGDDL